MDESFVCPPELGEYDDATAVLRGAIDELAVGELIKGESFSLQDAMSALELFDTKMDPRLNFQQPKYAVLHVLTLKHFSN